jgi:hypothetical protein
MDGRSVADGSGLGFAGWICGAVMAVMLDSAMVMGCGLGAESTWGSASVATSLPLRVSTLGSCCCRIVSLTIHASVICRSARQVRDRVVPALVVREGREACLVVSATSREYAAVLRQ